MLSKKQYSFATEICYKPISSKKAQNTSAENISKFAEEINLKLHINETTHGGQEITKTNSNTDEETYPLEDKPPVPTKILLQNRLNKL